MKPRSHPRGTRAEGQFAQDFWKLYVNAYLLGDDEEAIGNARAVFSEAVCTILEEHFDAETLNVPVFFSERLSNHTLASNISFRDGSQCIVVNSRFKAEPEIIAHTLVEEFAHTWQRRTGVDFEAQRSQFAYQERPYEIEAKRIATEVVGYEPEQYEIYIQREESDGVLYDKIL